MSVELDPPLATLADWVRASDPHAPHRLPLLAHAHRILRGQEEADDKRRQELAVRLERWRYRHLAEHRPQSDPLARRLAEVLDLATCRLVGQTRRPPRWPHDAVREACRDTRTMGCALCALSPEMPLDELEARARELTAEHFAGRTGRRRVLLYAPLYLSSYCINHCVYCGFRYPHQIERRHLSVDQAVEQAELLRRRGFRHVLLVAGDFPRLTRTRYFVEAIGALVARGITPAVEIAPQTAASYAEMAAAGACGVTLYQETYDEELYTIYHPRGTKSSYDWRLEGLERAAEAGMRRLGLGILLGLGRPREDLLALMRHARYLHDRFPECTIAFSLPRIHEAPQGFEPPYPVGDDLLVRMYCALRVAFPRAELVLSTREPAELRDRLADVCITQLSAGSSTVPGGYEDGAPDCRRAGQFPVADHRPPAEVEARLRQAGLEPHWRI